MDSIPKIIHYVWIGPNKPSKVSENCISSWKKELPDYEIKLWNEKNIELDSEFASCALKEKKWAFVSDFVRLKVLYEEGGIYLDTDMLVIRSFGELLTNKVFFGYEKPQLISCGIIGAEPKNPFIGYLLEEYKKKKFDSNQLPVMPNVVTDLYRKFVDRGAVKIYDVDYFYPYPFSARYGTTNPITFATKRTYAIHLWDMSWNSEFEFLYFKNGNHKKAVDVIFGKIMSNPSRPIKFYLRSINLLRKMLLYKLKTALS